MITKWYKFWNYLFNCKNRELSIIETILKFDSEDSLKNHYQ